MRSLLNIIKASQYDEMRSRGALAEESKHLLQSSPDQMTKREVRDQHQAIVNDAFKKARNIVDAAQSYSLNQLKESTMRMNEECAQMKIRSYEDGYNQGLSEGKTEGAALGYQSGYEEGLKRANEESKKTRDELSKMMETVEKKKTEILDQFEADLESLAVTIAQKVIKKELSIDEKAMKAIILDVMESYRNQEWVRIRVSPSTSELLTKADHNIIQALREISDNVKIVSAPEMTDGDCQIDLPDRLIDAGADTQLTSIKTALKL